jgi:hypothetical protein
MRILSDKAIQFRTYPVVPRKRVAFDEDTLVNFMSFGSDAPVFKCLGGYFTHYTYNLLDFFVSSWFEIFNRKWTEMFGGNFPKKIDDQVIARLSELSPMLQMNHINAVELTDHRIDLYQQLKDYTVIPEISDADMRKYPSLKGISSAKLYEVIEKSSRVKIKTDYPMRVVKENGKRKMLGWISLTNLTDRAPWSKLFEYRLLTEKKALDGRVIERIYKFGFNDLIGLGMIHNTICCGTWSVNPKLYTVSGDAQLLYRYLIIAGSRSKNHRIDYIGHRIGLRENQKSRLSRCIERLFEELKQSRLIRSYACQSYANGNIYYSFVMLRSPAKKKKVDKR